MNQSISNTFMTVSAQTHGAELCSIKGASGVEYLWQADPAVWGRHAPILFPIVGKLAKDSYTFNARDYSLPQHGFARDMVFALQEQSDCQLTYRLQSTQETRRDYPFIFTLSVVYTLNDNCIEVRYELLNNGPDMMPFSIGAHPGFALAWAPDDVPTDYFLEFNQSEILDTHTLGADHLLGGETGRILDHETQLPIRNDLFDRDALIFLDMKSDRVALRSNKHPNRLTVSFPGFPCLGIWAKPAAPFVCIEPWYGHADHTGSDGNILNKPGIIQLPAADTFICAYTITIDE